VITVQRLPDMNGIEFLEKVLILYTDCMRMIMTGRNRNLSAIKIPSERGT
jgi:hypothetical protein